MQIVGYLADNEVRMSETFAWIRALVLVTIQVMENFLNLDFHRVDLTDAESENSSGLLSSLLGVGCECDGYSLRIVGHSLGGAIAALLGLRLYKLYPTLHVYAYGPLPCVDMVIAEACSEFVTSIVHNNEFSTRISVGALQWLCAAAIVALAQDSKADKALIFRLARQFLFVSMNKSRRIEVVVPSAVHSAATTVELDHEDYVGSKKVDHSYFSVE